MSALFKRYIATLTSTSSIVSKWDSGISNKALVFSNNDTNAKRPGNAACYPAAFAQLTSGVCSFTIKIDSLPNKGNWLTFGLAEKGFAADSSDGFGRESKSWGVAMECNSSGTSSATMHSGSKTSIASLPRRLKEGDMLSGLVDLDCGRFTFSLNGAEFSHLFSVPKATDRSKYVWGMTFATDLVVTILPTVPTITAAPAASSANMSVQRSKVWVVDMSNSHLTYTDNNTTAQRVGNVSCYPIAMSALQGPAAVFSVRIDSLSGKSNWLTFGLAKKGIAKDSSDGMGRTKDSWGIADDRSSSSSSATYHDCGSKALGSLPRKLREGDVLTAEANTSAGWCEVRLNETEFKHRFSIPAGAHEGYVFGVSFSNDAKVCILSAASVNTHRPTAGTVAATSALPATIGSPLAWAPELSQPSLTFTNSNKTAHRVGNVSCYPAAFARLAQDSCAFHVRIASSPMSQNWLTFGLAKQGFALTNSDGMGRTANSWGIAEERTSGGSIGGVYACSKTSLCSLPRRLQEGDVLSAVVDAPAGWCEVRLNYSEFTHRFSIPRGSREDYLFGMTFASDLQVTVVSESPAVPAAVLKPAAAPVASRSVQRSKVWAVDLSNSHLAYTDSNTTAQRVGNVSCYPIAVSALHGPAAVFSVRIDSLSGKSNWLTFGLAKKGIAKDSSDGMGRTKDSWGIADDRSSSSSSSATYHDCGSKALGSLPRKLREGDVLTAETNTPAGWFEVRLNETEFKHRFSIPAGAHDGYVFGVSFSNDAKVCILPTASVNTHRPVVGTVAAASALPATSGSPFAWAPELSQPSLTFTNSNKTAHRVGNVSCYPAAFARLAQDSCAFHVRIDSSPISQNWLTFGLAKQGFALTNSDGMGRTANSWGIAEERTSGGSIGGVYACSKTSLGSLPRRLQEGDVLSAVVDAPAGWCEVCLNYSEFTHRFSIPRGSREDYLFGMTFASDLQVTVVSESPTVSAAVLKPAASTVASRSKRRSTVWAVDMSNSHLTYTDNNTTAQRLGSVSCYPVAVSALQGPAAVFSVRIDCLSGKSNWLTFGLAKKDIAKDSSDGMGRTKDSWGIADDRSSSSSSATYHACGTKALGSLPRKLREGDVLTAEANTSTGWCEVRLNETEFKHRFSIPAGAHEGYVFGVSFSNDAKVCILPTASGSATTPAAAIVPAVNPSGAVWDKGLSNKQLTFSNGDTSARRVGSVSSYPAAFVPLPAAHAILQVKVTAVPIGQNWLTFGLVKAGFKASSSDGVGKNADSWGIVDERSSSGNNATMRGCGSTMETLARKLQEGDVLTAEADVAAGWCEVRLNQTECTHRFVIPVGSKESYLFGATFSNDTECTILSCSAVAAVSKAVTSSAKAGAVPVAVTVVGDLNEATFTAQDKFALDTFLQSFPVGADMKQVMCTVAAHDRTLNLLVSKQKECPSLFWFYPKQPKLRNWLTNPTKCLFQDTLMMVVVCPVTMRTVQCGPDGVGWEVNLPKKWVKQWGPAILFSVYVLQAAVLAGRIVGIPLPCVPGVGDVKGALGLTGMLGGVRAGKEHLQEISESLRTFASVTEDIADAHPEMQLLSSALREGSSKQRDTGQQQPLSADLPMHLVDEAYKSIHTFLTTGENVKLGKLEDQLRGRMERVMAPDGDIEWVSVEGRQAWLDKHRGLVAERIESKPSPIAVTAVLTTALTPPSPSPATTPTLTVTSSWLADRLLLVGVSAAVAADCERCLVVSEGFTTEASFACLPAAAMTMDYLKGVGITGMGTIGQLLSLHEELQLERSRLASVSNASFDSSDLSVESAATFTLDEKVAVQKTMDTLTQELNKLRTTAQSQQQAGPNAPRGGSGRGGLALQQAQCNMTNPRTQQPYSLDELVEEIQFLQRQVALCNVSIADVANATEERLGQLPTPPVTTAWDPPHEQRKKKKQPNNIFNIFKKH